MKTSVTVGALVCFVLSVGGWYFIGVSLTGPGDCGLGTGGVYHISETNQSVTSSADAWSLVEDKRDQRFLAKQVFARDNFSTYEPATLDRTFKKAIQSRRDVDESKTIYYFTPNGTTHYRSGTIGVTEDGGIFAVEVGAC